MPSEILLPLARVTDANANPYSGAKWHFYESGTTTPQAVYADADLSVSLGSTVTADSGGKFPAIYFDAGLSYRGVCENASGSVTLHDIDPINNAVLATLADYVTKTGTETLSNKTFTGAIKFATGSGRIGIVNGSTPITSPMGLLHIKNENGAGVGLLVQSYWQGGTGSAYTNNDVVLFETYNKTLSAAANRSWAASCSNAYHDIPEGVTDSGTRVGVIGWAVSVHGRPGYVHSGTIDSLHGVEGASGFQGGGTPATAAIAEAAGVRGLIYADAPGCTIQFARAGMFVSDCLGLDGTPGTASTVADNVAVYARARNGVDANYSFFGEAGLLFNNDQVAARSAYSQASPAFSSRVEGNALEFGHSDSTGYGSNLGATFSAGYPFLAFCAEVDSTGDTFTTRGKLGSVISSNLAGSLIFSRLTNASASGQALTEMARFDPSGRLMLASVPTFADNAAAITGGLVTDTVYKTVAGELRIVV